MPRIFITLLSIFLCHELTVLTAQQTTFSFDHFEAQLIDNQCIGTFSIHHENVGDLYLMERSKDGTSFEQIGDWIECHDDTDWNTYQCNDFEPYTGISYYRIRHIALTEDRFNFSEIIQVIYTPENQQIIARPNPFETQFTLEFISTPYPNSYIQIVNSFGQMVHSEYIPDHTISMPISMAAHPSGFYSIWVVQNGRRRLSQKVIKM